MNDEINLFLNRRVNNRLEYLSVDGDLDFVTSADRRPIESYVRVCNVNEREIRLQISRCQSNLLPRGWKWSEVVPQEPRYYPPFWDRSLCLIFFYILAA